MTCYTSTVKYHLKELIYLFCSVTSSEKVDKENRYSEFTIVSLPYPGCEFFKEYRNNNYVAKGLIFDWTQSHVDAVIGVPDDAISLQLKIDWEKYKVKILYIYIYKFIIAKIGILMNIEQVRGTYESKTSSNPTELVEFTC